MLISRQELTRIVGEPMVQQAEAMPAPEFEEQKWNHLTTLLPLVDQLAHTPLLEARRARLTGLPPAMQRLLIRHLIDTNEVE
ncbi:MAG: hypothetical protein RBU29_01240 [bacterium]|jgi:hypothetical protein|nr:hypothetical protein [bacterium]